MQEWVIWTVGALVALVTTLLGVVAYRGRSASQVARESTDRGVRASAERHAAAMEEERAAVEAAGEDLATDREEVAEVASIDDADERSDALAALGRGRSSQR